MWRAAPAGIRTPAARPTARSDGPPVSRTRSVAIGPALVSTPITRRPPPGVGTTQEAEERRPLAQLDARRLHRERVGTDVARRVDVAVGREEAAAAVAVRGERRDERRGLGRGQPADVEALGLLHRDALAAGPLVVLGDREDQVAQLAEAGVGADRLGLAAVEVDRPAAERDGRRRPALGPDDPGGAGARAHPGEAPLEDDDPAGAVRLREVRGPAADRARADDDEVGLVGRRHRSSIGRRPAASLGCPVRR